MGREGVLEELELDLVLDVDARGAHRLRDRRLMVVDGEIDQNRLLSTKMKLVRENLEGLCMNKERLERRGGNREKGSKKDSEKKKKRGET